MASAAVSVRRLGPNGCQVHRVHVPRCYDVDLHHVWPLGEGGPETPENTVRICPTGHRNVHELLRLLLE